MKRNLTLLTLAFCLLATQSAMAQSNLELRRFGGSLGLIDVDGMGGTAGFGVRADMGTITPRIALEPNLEYWSNSEGVSGASVSLRDVSIGARAKYMFQATNPNLRPYVGAGLGLHFFKAEAEVYDAFSGQTLESEDSATKLGFDIGGGIANALSAQTDLFAEAWYTAVSDFDHMGIRVGFMRAFGHTAAARTTPAPAKAPARKGTTRR